MNARRQAAETVMRMTAAERARVQAVARRLGLRDWRTLPVLVATGEGDRIRADLDPMDVEARRVLDALIEGFGFDPQPTHEVLQSGRDPYAHLPPVRFAGALGPGDATPLTDALLSVRIWDGTLAVEGYRSADGRTIAPLALTWPGPDAERDLSRPLPLLAIGTPTNPLAPGTRQVGTIERIWRHQPDPSLPVFLIQAAGRFDARLMGRHRGPWNVGVDLGTTPDLTTDRLTGDLTYSSAPLLGAHCGPVGVYHPAWPECRIEARRPAA